MAQQYYTYSPPMVMATGPVAHVMQPSMTRVGSAAALGAVLGHGQSMTGLWPTREVSSPTVRVVHAHQAAASPSSHQAAASPSPRVVLRKEQQPAAQSPHAAAKGEAEAAEAPPGKGEAAAATGSPTGSPLPAAALAKRVAAAEQPAAGTEAAVEEQPASAGDLSQRATSAGCDSPRRAASPGVDSPRRSGSPGVDSPRRAASPGGGGDSPRKGGLKAQRSYVDLYEEAFSRKQRLHTRQENAGIIQELEAKQRLEEFEKGMKERRRLYRGKDKDTRTHLEREAELLKRREETKKKFEAERDAQASEELRECTFRPKTTKSRESFTKRSSSPGLSPTGSPTSGFDQGGTIAKLRKLAERQRMATSALRLVAADEAQLREDLRTMHAAMQERFQQQETQRVVEMLKRGDTANSTHGGLIQRVQATVAAGNDPAAVQALIAELVSSSNQEIQRRTSDALEPKRLEAEGELYERRVALVKELETVEAEAAELTALSGGSLQHNAREAGIELGIAEHALRSLPSRPGMSLIATLPPGTQLQPHGMSTVSTTVGGCSPDSVRAIASQTPRSPGSECARLVVRDADPHQPVKRRLEFMEEYAAALAASQRRAASHVIIYR